MSTYKVIEIIGSSYSSWADAAKTAVEKACKTLKGLRVAEVTQLDMSIEDDGKLLYRTRLKLSFKVESFEGYADDLGPKPYAQEEG